MFLMDFFQKSVCCPRGAVNQILCIVFSFRLVRTNEASKVVLEIRAAPPCTFSLKSLALYESRCVYVAFYLTQLCDLVKAKHAFLKRVFECGYFSLRKLISPSGHVIVDQILNVIDKCCF